MLGSTAACRLPRCSRPRSSLADGYPIDAETANNIERWKGTLRKWPYSKSVMLPHQGETREAPQPGEIFRQADLAATLRKLVEAERQALAAGKSRREAIAAAHERFYRGDVAAEFVRGLSEAGGLITPEDLARWKPRIEEPLSTSYRGVDVYKLDTWTQGPAMLQTLNILENFDLRGMGYNSANYIHTVYQAMNLAFADRDFYYGDPLLSARGAAARSAVKGLCEERASTIRPDRNDAAAGPGDPYPYQDGKNPFADLLHARTAARARRHPKIPPPWPRPTRLTRPSLRDSRTVFSAVRRAWSPPTPRDGSSR